MAFGDLTNLADVKAWLRPSNTGGLPADDDALLSTLITGASGFITSYISRNILQTDYEELRDGQGPSSPNFVFANFPVSAVIMVAIAGILIPPIPIVTPTQLGVPVVTFAGGPAGYIFTPTELVIRGFWVPREKLCVQLQYTAGYATIPPEIGQLAKELVALRYKERNRPGEVSQRSAPETVVTYSVADMSASMRTLLKQYRAVAPVSGFSRVIASNNTNTSIVASI